MKNLLLSSVFTSALLLAGCATTNAPKVAVQSTQKHEIINIIDNVGTLADARKWSELENLFDKKVLLDYSSMTKQPAETLSTKEIMNRWSAFLPGFDWTSHKNTNQKVTLIDATHAKATSDIKATHYIKGANGGEFWVVNGSYDYTLTNKNGAWKIEYMKLNFKSTEGNNNLPNLALKRAK